MTPRLLSRLSLGALGIASIALGACRAAPVSPSPGASQVRAEPSLSEVLTRARASYDAEPSDTGYSLAGRGTFLGAPADYGITFDSAGSFAMSYTGLLSQVTAFDGRQAWEQDWAGSSRRLHGGERTANVLPNWLLTGQWVERAADLDLRVESPESASPETLTLSFAVGGYSPRGLIELDRATMMPRRVQWGEDAQETVVTYAGAKDFGIITLPASFRFVSGLANYETTIDRVEPAPVFIRSPYEYLGGAGAVRFDPALPPPLEVKRTSTGHVLVRGLLNGQDLGWFIFDTGAGANILSLPAAAALGLEGFGGVDASGVGGSVPTRFYQAQSMTIGPATIDDPVMVGLDLAFLEPIFGEKIAGIVGYNMLTHVVAEVDMATGAVSLFDPRGYARDGVAWTPAQLMQRHPCIEGAFEGHTSLFRIDTGAGADTVIFHSGTVAAMNLLEGRQTTPATLGGVGGTIAAAKGTLRDFTIAGTRHENVTATFALPGGRAFNDPWIGGTIGGGFLGEVIMVLDYGGERVGFVAKPE